MPKRTGAYSQSRMIATAPPKDVPLSTVLMMMSVSTATDNVRKNSSCCYDEFEPHHIQYQFQDS